LPLSPLEINQCWYSVACLFYTLQVGIHVLIFFLANLAKGNMSFCHHLVSVVCHLFTFHILIFSENPQPNELKFGRKHLWKVLSKECTFCYDPLPNMVTITCCFSAKHAALRTKSKDWLAQNQNNVSEWGGVFIRGLLFQWASILKIQLSLLV
jgi:hypothetical protein